MQRGVFQRACQKIFPCSQRNSSAEAGGKRLVIVRPKAGGGAGRVVEWRLQLALEAAADAVVKDFLRHQAARLAEMVEPAQADSDVADFVMVDAVQDRGGRGVARAFEATAISRVASSSRTAASPEAWRRRR